MEGGGVARAPKDPQATWGAGCVVHMFLKRMQMALTLYGIYPNTSWSHLPKAVMSFHINQTQNQHSRNKHTLRVMGELAVGASRCRGESVFNYVNSYKFENQLQRSSSQNPTMSVFKTSTSGFMKHSICIYDIKCVCFCWSSPLRLVNDPEGGAHNDLPAQSYQFILNARISILSS